MDGQGASGTAWNSKESVNHGMKSRSGSSSIDADIALEYLSVPADCSAGEAQVEVSVLLPIKRQERCRGS